MINYRIKVSNGLYQAPDIYVTAPKDIKNEDLINLARQKSGLGRFIEWGFTC